MNVFLSSLEHGPVAWGKVAGPTYAAWIVASKRSAGRIAVLMFSVVCPLGVIMLFLTSQTSFNLVLLAAWPIFFLATAAVWFALDRRHGNVGRRIADDLWSRGLAVAGVPPTSRPRDFARWVALNRTSAEQLESAAQRAITSSPPRRSAGRSPVILRLSLLLSIASIAFLVFAIVWGLDQTAGATSTSVQSQLVFVFTVTAVGIWGAVEAFGSYLCAAGGRIPRKIVSVQAPLVVSAVAVAAVFAPSLLALEIAAGALWLGAMALLWSRPASDYIDATTALHRSNVEAVNRRIQLIAQLDPVVPQQSSD